MKPKICVCVETITLIVVSVVLRTAQAEFAASHRVSDMQEL